MGQVKVGDVILDKYEVTEVLGRGGMGLVVAARHRKLGGFVALKFLKPFFQDDPEMSARFARGRSGQTSKNRATRITPCGIELVAGPERP